MLPRTANRSNKSKLRSSKRCATGRGTSISEAAFMGTDADIQTAQVHEGQYIDDTLDVGDNELLGINLLKGVLDLVPPSRQSSIDQYSLADRFVSVRYTLVHMSPIAIPAARKYSIACIPADGIGPEVITAGVKVLKTLSDTLGTFALEFEEYDWSSETYKQTGKYIPDDGLKQLKKHDAILFGAVGAPDVPDHISLWGLRLAICQPFQQYANVRPTKILKGTSSPLRNASHGDLDWVIIRENSEGEYAGQGGRSHRGKAWETATEVSIFTRHGVERIMRFAFETAQKRPRKQLTVVTKSNAQRNGLVLWDEVAADVANEYADVKVDKMLVDAMTCRMVLNPQSLDTIVATNLHADILSDLAAALAGSIGIAPTSNLDPTRENPSMFEPIHGSAFDITGKGIANPVATFWTASEMLAWLGEEEAAKHLLDCVEKVTENGIATADLGGSNTTKEVTQAVCEEIRKTVGTISKTHLMKRNSTLTQMDFFRDVHVQEELDDAALDEIDAAANLPLLNGSDDRPKKTRSHGKSVKTEKSRGDSQEDYEPAKKRKRHNGATSVLEQNVRRTSSRLADKEDKSNKLFGDPRSTFRETPQSSVKSVVKNRVLETAEEEHASSQIKSGRFASVVELSPAKANIGQGRLLPAAEAEKEESNGTEIPGTSQAEGDVYLAEAPTCEADVVVERSPSQGRQTAQLSGVLVRDFAPATSHTTSSKDKDEGSSKEAVPPKTPPPQAAKQGKQDEREDSDIDFDSPIANDTQFNAEAHGTTETTTAVVTAVALSHVQIHHYYHATISTQEATQYGLLSSLVPTAESPEAAVKKEPVTIKEDSSSIGMLSLSQIPPAERESQVVDLGLGEEEEEIDLDARLHSQHDQRHHQPGGVVMEKKADDAALSTRIRQESQLSQSVVGQEGGGAEVESRTSSLSSPSSPSSFPLNHNHAHHSPIPGFNNDTQSNFTQGGHVTAAYIHRQRDLGVLPKWYTPKPYRVPGYTRR
ncbi:hypothetical protein DV737_g5476, partial [Chaetothyriales sp. CBS 132003]